MSLETNILLFIILKNQNIMEFRKDEHEFIMFLYI